MTDLTYVFWIAMIIMGLAFVGEGAVLASSTPRLTDPSLKLAFYGLSIAIVGIGLSFVPLGISEISRVRYSRHIRIQLATIIRMLEEAGGEPEPSKQVP